MLSPRATPRPSSGQRLSFLRRFSNDARGSIAIMFSLMFVALALFVGGAVDLGRWLQARNQTAAAMDAAVLAGARMLQLDRQNVAEAVKVAQKYYAENTKGRTEVFDDAPSFNAINNNKAFTGSSHPYIKTSFLGFARVSKLPLDIHAEAALPDKPLEISMMLDVTGSMAGTKIRDLKLAAADLVNIVIPDGANTDKVRIALIPFAEGVRLPTTANAKARGTPAANVKYKVWGQNIFYYPSECVVERKGTNKYSETAPGSNAYVMTLFNSNGKCGLPAADELVPLTKDKNLLTSRINGLTLSLSTAGQIGTAWAWYTLSPSWNSLWDASSAASAYGGDTQKIAILMTDGEYNLEYDSNGVSTSSSGAGSAANADSTTQARALCTEMKKKVLVYTVGFALGGNQTAITTLSNCATNASMAYKADNGNELQQAFRDIALKINQLYLTQ